MRLLATGAPSLLRLNIISSLRHVRRKTFPAHTHNPQVLVLGKKKTVSKKRPPPLPEKVQREVSSPTPYKSCLEWVGVVQGVIIGVWTFTGRGMSDLRWNLRRRGICSNSVYVMNGSLKAPKKCRTITAVSSTLNVTPRAYCIAKVNISPREEQNRTGALSGVRGLNGRWTTKAKQETPPVQTEAGQPVDHALLGGAQSDSAAVNVGVDAAEGAGDLCLGMAVGISPAQLVTFVASFREVAPGAELVLFFEAPISARFNDIIDM